MPSFNPGIAYNLIHNPSSVAVGDVNGDGSADLVAVGYGNVINSVSVLLNNGNGTFGSPDNYTASNAPSSVALGDLDGDGDLDLVVSSPFTVVLVLRNDGVGAFGDASVHSVGSDPQAVDVGDLDADGDLDIVVANRGSDTVSVLLNNGDGSFTDAINYSAALKLNGGRELNHVI